MTRDQVEKLICSGRKLSFNAAAEVWKFIFDNNLVDEFCKTYGTLYLAEGIVGINFWKTFYKKYPNYYDDIEKKLTSEAEKMIQLKSAKKIIAEMDKKYKNLGTMKLISEKIASVMDNRYAIPQSRHPGCFNLSALYKETETYKETIKFLKEQNSSNDTNDIKAEELLTSEILWPYMWPGDGFVDPNTLPRRADY